MAERTTRTGMDRATGRLLRGRAHAEQSVRDVLATRTITRIMLLAYGADLHPLRGENMTAANVLRAYAAMVGAVHAWEPAVRIVRMEPWFLDGRAGAIGFLLHYLFFPYGHLGDFSVVEDLDMRVPMTALARGNGALA